MSDIRQSAEKALRRQGDEDEIIMIDKDGKVFSSNDIRGQTSGRGKPTVFRDEHGEY
jgi:hypothetical protein